MNAATILAFAEFLTKAVPVAFKTIADARAFIARANSDTPPTAEEWAALIATVEHDEDVVLAPFPSRLPPEPA